MKLGMQVHYITPTTTACFHDDYMFVKKIASSILKLVNGNTHGDETQYACVSHCFHDDHIV